MSTQDTDRTPPRDEVPPEEAPDGADPTPGPWVVGDPSQGVIHPSCAREDSSLARTVAITEWSKDREGRKHPRSDEMRANAELIAAAGTAAHEAKQMGYDPQKAVEKLVALISAAEEVVKNPDDLAPKLQLMGVLDSAGSDTRCSQCFRYIDDIDEGMILDGEMVCVLCARQWERTSPPTGQPHDPSKLEGAPSQAEGGG